MKVYKRVNYTVILNCSLITQATIQQIKLIGVGINCYYIE